MGFYQSNTSSGFKPPVIDFDFTIFFLYSFPFAVFYLILFGNWKYINRNCINSFFYPIKTIQARSAHQV